MNNLLHSTILKGLTSFPSIKNTTEMRASAWVNINPPDAFNLKHNHPTSDLSGVLWLKCQKDCGNIVFESPRSFATHREIDSYTEDFKKDNNYFHSFHFFSVSFKGLWSFFSGPGLLLSAFSG